MAAGTPLSPSPDDLVRELPQMLTSIGSMSDSVTQLQTRLTGLMANPTDPYEGDGPMIRARMYEYTLDSDRLRFDQLMGKVEDLENTIAFITAETTRNSETLESELRNIREEVRGSGARVPAHRSPKNITETKGFEKLKSYTGERLALQNHNMADPDRSFLRVPNAQVGPKRN
jgi:hypothetical protein